MKLDKKSMLLYGITDRTWTQTKSLKQQVELALKGGVTCLQLREKNLAFNDFLDEALEIKNLCKQYNVPFIINDNIDIAIQSKADGIHIGQSDMPLKQVRKIVDKDMIIGVSAKTVDQAVEAEKNGANYLGVGAVFHTSTKLDATEVSFSTLKAICKAVSIPVVAIGGINKNNIMKLSGSGIDGVALISAIFSAQNIEMQCKELKCIIEKIVKY